MKLEQSSKVEQDCLDLDFRVWFKRPDNGQTWLTINRHTFQDSLSCTVGAISFYR